MKKIKILHIATECYPAAKAGGLGDVVGALPLYLPQYGVEASVVIPKYANKWFGSQKFTTVKKGHFQMGDSSVQYRVQKLRGDGLGFAFYCIDIPGLFDRENVYLGADGEGYADEPERNVAFQTAIMEWLTHGRQSFDGLHCHDHMTGLIPFMTKYCEAYSHMQEVPIYFTIHNGQYRGEWDWRYGKLLPAHGEHGGVLDWDGSINGLATAIKTAWHVNTVSPNYMKEIVRDADSLVGLYYSERYKCSGILNGVDTVLWNPATDKFLESHLEAGNWKEFKKESKRLLTKKYGLKAKAPLVGFIGRMAWQKGADILADAIKELLYDGHKVSFVILGSGDKAIEASLTQLATDYKGQVATVIAYDEGLARAIYAGCDYLVMPSRFEPCGLNQLFAMRYGTVPVVSPVGGLVDTVPDVRKGGNGIVAIDADVASFVVALLRAVELYGDQKQFLQLRQKIAALDYSWVKSGGDYAALYRKYI